MAFEEMSLTNERLFGGEVSKVANLIFARDLAKREFGVSSDQWINAGVKMLEYYVPLKPRDRAKADAEAQRLLNEELNRQRKEQ